MPKDLLGPIDRVTGIEGHLYTPRLFPLQVAKPTSFKGGAAEAQAVAMLLLAGRPFDVEDTSLQCQAVFVLLCMGGRRIRIEVAQVLNVVFIEGEAFQVDTPSIMQKLQGMMK